MIGLGLVLLRYVEVSLFHSFQLNISAFRVLRAAIECDDRRRRRFSRRRRRKSVK